MKHTEEAKKRISKNHARYWLGKKRPNLFSLESRKIISEQLLGRKLSETTRQKISESNKGRIVSEATRIKIGLANKGRQRSEDFKEKMSLARIGIKHSEQHKQMISRALVGQKKTPQHRMNLSLAFRGKKKEHITDEKHPMWMGDRVGYFALHSWVKRKLGTPNTCENCENNGLRPRQYHWANKSGEYERDLSDWLRLCVKCHSAYDRGKLALT